MTIYSIDKSYIDYAIGTDLTAWDNAYAAYLVTELQATDNLDVDLGYLGIDYSDPEVQEYNQMSSSQYAGQIATGYKESIIAIPMYLQTLIFLYATLGTCVTGGAYTHTISLNTSQTPISLGFHFEKEMTGQDLRHDFFGFMPDTWNLRCGDDKSRWKAKQKFVGKFAKSQSAASDLTEPSKMTLAKYEWNDFKHASGALSFLYNSNPLEFDIRAFDLTVKRTKPLWGARNATGYPSAANIAGVGIDLTLEGYVTGDNIRTIMATKPISYAGELSGSIIGYKSATASISIPLHYLYLIPDQDVMNATDWYEKKTLKFKTLSPSSSISGVDINSLDKTYYEND